MDTGEGRMLPLPTPPGRTDPIEVRCLPCAKGRREASAPLLAIIQPQDPDADMEWHHLVIRQPIRMSADTVSDLAAKRRDIWRRADKPSTTDPADLFTGRTRTVDVGFVDVTTERVTGAEWDGRFDLKCPACGHVPSKWPVKSLVTLVRQKAMSAGSARYVCV